MNSEMSEKRSITESQKPPNVARPIAVSRGDLAVDEIEDVRDDHDEAGEHEAPERQRPGRGDVDQHADERQNIGMDPQRDAEAMIAPQRKHAERRRWRR